MEEGKKLIEKVTGKRKLGRDQCLIMILVGILLCVIALPVQKKSSESDISNIIDGKVSYHTQTDTGEISQEQDVDSETYAGYWEQRLEDALRYVDGVGSVKVLITLKGSEQRIVEKDGPEERSDTAETDAAGGSRTIGESRIEKSTIYTVDDRGQSVPYVVMTIPPPVEGVVVIAQGAQQQSVQENIIEAIQVLFDIDANKIKIVKMKNNQ